MAPPPIFAALSPLGGSPSRKIVSVSSGTRVPSASTTDVKRMPSRARSFRRPPRSTSVTSPCAVAPARDRDAIADAHVAGDARHHFILDTGALARDGGFDLQTDDRVGRDNQFLELRRGRFNWLDGLRLRCALDRAHRLNGGRRRNLRFFPDRRGERCLLPPQEVTLGSASWGRRTWRSLSTGGATRGLGAGAGGATGSAGLVGHNRFGLLNARRLRKGRG